LPHPAASSRIDCPRSLLRNDARTFSRRNFVGRARPRAVETRGMCKCRATAKGGPCHAGQAGNGGAAGVAGFLLTRRFKHRKMNVQQTATQEAPLTATTAATAASTSILGIIFAFVMRYSMQRLPQIALWLMKGSSQTDPAPVVVDTTHLPPPRYRANGTHT
jgi:hypothetical protein